LDIQRVFVYKLIYENLACAASVAALICGAIGTTDPDHHTAADIT